VPAAASPSAAAPERWPAGAAGRESPASERAARRRRRLAALTVAGGLALFGWRELAAMRADGSTVDEPSHLAYAERAVAQGTFERDAEVYNSKMPVSVLNALPVLAAERLGVSLEHRRWLWLGRLPTVGLGLALGWLVFHWARALFGLRGGALALFLYTFCPNVLAHSHMVTTDVATALGMFGATYAFWRYRRQPSGWRLAVAAAAFGAAQLTKATALFLVPIFLIVAAIEAVGRWRRRATPATATVAPAPAPGGAPEVVTSVAASPVAGPPAPRAARRFVAALAPAGALLAGAVIALNLGFAGEGTLTPLARYQPVSRSFQQLASLPLLRQLPVPVPQPYVAGLDMVARDVRAGSLSYLHGKFSAAGFRDYYLVALLIKVPLGTLALLVLAGWLAATGRVRAPGAEAWLLVPPAFLLAYLSFAFELQIGLRYLLPAFPFLFVFAARAAAWRPRSKRLAAAVPLLAAATAVSSLAAHPRYIPYFNELIGGTRNGYRWLTDSNVDWGQDNEFMREVYARRSPVRVWIEPGGPIAGRVAVGLMTLTTRHTWLREHFQPAALVHGSWAVFDVARDEIDRCCAGQEPAWRMTDDASDLAFAGEPIGGGDGVGVRYLSRLNDGMLGANSDWDAARSSPMPAPVRAWFGIEWERPRQVGRVVAYPGFYSRGPDARRYLATDYVLQSWDGHGWVDIPGTRVTGNHRVHVEHEFPPLRTTRLRLLIERERNERGTEEIPGTFRAVCLELAIYPD
jgi:Dolichyl-phosphate-mannose-protein mannosyltransferase